MELQPNLLLLLACPFQLSRAKQRFSQRVLDLVREFFSKENWAVSTLSFDGLPISEQYDIIRQTSLFVSVSGTGSHWAAFLREGAVSIVIESRGFNANQGLCAVVPQVYCLSVNSTSQSSLKNSNISVVEESMNRSLQVASQRLQHSQCSD